MTPIVSQQVHKQGDIPSFPATEPIVLVCAADDNYAMPLAVMLRSALENLGDKRKLSIFIIDGGIKAENKQKIAHSINLNRVELAWLTPVEKLLDEVKTATYYTKAIHHKVFIPELLPQYQKAIYLDSDLLVFEDLGKLWDIDMNDWNALAVEDIYPDPLVHGYRDLLPPEDYEDLKVFNSGVMVINLEKCRSEKTSIKAIEYVSQYKLPGNQVALSLTLKDKWKELDPRWNRTAGIYEYDSWEKSPFSQDEFNNLVNHPYIIHFTSADKPWNSINRCPEQELFYHYLDMTAWSGWRFTQWKRMQRRLVREVNGIQKKLFPK
jgi:lipopolysaccharide biosynthesis glycosyltransferase